MWRDFIFKNMMLDESNWDANNPCNIYLKIIFNMF